MERMVDICFLSAKHPPTDKRVFDKEAVSLARAGFSVAHIAPGTMPSGRKSGVDIRTYAEPTNLKDRVLQIPRLYRLAADIDAACYHCNEVDSWVVGVLLKLLKQRKVVFDVHEIYPAEFAESRFPPFARHGVAGAVRAVIRVLTPFTDRIVLAKESARPDYSGSESKQVVVRNFVSLEAAGDRDRKRDARGRSGRLRAVHVGGMNRERGWPQLVDALRKPGLENVDVVLLGGFVGEDGRDFHAAAAAAGLADRFEVVPWLPFGEAYEKMRQCDIGMVLFQPGRLNHVHALPHKLFDYMLAELPVIVPNFAIEVSRIVEEAGCGLLVNTGEPLQIANALRTLVGDPEGRARMGALGRTAVLERYNWENEAKTLVDCYLELLPHHASSAEGHTHAQ